jgi:hypothetical protein
LPEQVAVFGCGAFAAASDEQHLQIHPLAGKSRSCSGNTVSSSNTSRRHRLPHARFAESPPPAHRASRG